MPAIWMDVDVALSEVPVNILALIDDTDFKTREEAVVYNQAGMDLVWNFVTTAGAYTQTAVTPTTGGNYDWANKGNGMYSIEIPASGGASINNDTEGHGWFTGFATGILPWRSPIIGFRAASLNNSLIDGGDVLDTNTTQWNGTNVATPSVAGVPEVDLTHILGASQSATDLKDFADVGYDPATNKVQGVVLVDTTTDVTNEVSADVTKISGDSNSANNLELDYDGTGYAKANSTIGTCTTNTDMRGTDGANTTVPDVAGTAATLHGITDGKVDAVQATADAIETDTQNIQSNIGTIEDLGTGATLAKNTRDIAGATFASGTDSNEAIRDRGDSAWITGAGGDATEAKQDIIIANIGTIEDLGTGTTLAKNNRDIAGATFVTGTDSNESIRDRGDAAWITGGGGSISDIINIQPLVPNDIDLANTASYRLGIMLFNSLDDLPTTAEITPGTISIDRKTIGATSWSSVVSDAASSEIDGLVYYDEVFDSGTNYAEGDSIRITFKSIKVTVAANDYEIIGTTGRIFYTSIRQTMRGTDGANTTVPDVAGTAATLHGITDGKVDAVQTTADAIEVDTQDIQTQIGTAGAGLTDLGGMSTGMKAEVNAEADTALTDYDPPTRTEATADKAEIIVQVNANETKIDAVQATADAIETDTQDIQSKIGTVEDLGTGATIGKNARDIAGATFATGTDSNEAIRDRGDAAWITGSGGDATEAKQDAIIATIGVAGLGLTDLGGMSTGMKAEVNAEADTALTDYDPPTRTEATADKDAIIVEVDANETKIDTVISNIAALNNVSSADVNAACDTALTDYDGPTKAEMDSGFAALNNISTTQVAAAVWNASRGSYIAANSFGQMLQAIRSGTAQAGASLSITLDASASSITNFYTNCIVHVISGTGVSQSRRITAYNGTTKVATVATTWGTIPNGTSIFVIYPKAQVNAAISSANIDAIADKVWDEDLSGHVAAGSAGQNQNRIDEIDTGVDAIEAKLPTNYIMGSAVQTAKDDEIDSIKTTVEALNDLSSADVQAACDTAITANTDIDNIDTGVNNIEAKLPTSYIMGSSVQTGKDDEIDSIKTTVEGLNDLSAAQVNAEVDTALGDARLNELMTAALGSQPTAGSLFGDLTEGDAGTQRFTANALEEAPTGGTALTSQEVRDAMKLAPTVGIPAAGSVDTHLDDLLTNVGTVDTVVDAIKIVTDALPNAGALTDIDTGVNAIEAKLPTNYIMGSSVQTDKDDEIDSIKSTIEGLNDLSAAQVNAEVDTALSDVRLNELMTSALTSQPVAGSMFADLTEDDGGTQRFNANALEQAPTGGTNPNVLIDTTINVVTDQTHFTLNSGSNDDDAYKNQAFVVYDASDSDSPSIRVCAGYVGATKTVTLDSAPDFTIISGDGARAFVTAPGTSAPTVGQIRTEMDDNSTKLTAIDTGVDNIELKLPTNYIMGSSAQTDKDDEINAIKAKTDLLTFTTGNVHADIQEYNTHPDTDLNADQSGVTVGTVNALGAQAKLDVNTEMDTALSDIGLDHLIKVAVTGTDVTDNSIIAQIVSKSATADWDTFNNTTDALEAISDSGGGGLTAQQIRDAMKLAPTVGDPAVGSIDNHLDDIQAIIDNLPNGGSLTDIDTGVNNIESKLPSKDYLVGTANSDGNIELDGAIGAFVVGAFANHPDVDLNADQSGATVGVVNAFGAQAKLDVNAEIDIALSDIGLDHLIHAAVTGADVADGSIVASIVSKAATPDWDSFNNITDALEAISDTAISGSDILNITIDGTATLEIAMKQILAYCGNNITRSGDVYTYRNYDDDAGTMVITGSDSGRVRS